MSRLRDERGSVFVLAAVMIPVFLVLTALVVDAGNWFTHKRQLQNRADAGALAAGVAYANNWPACSQDDDTAVKAAAAQRIANAARQYAADPEISDYTDLNALASVPGVVPAAFYNENIAKQTSLDVVVNSTTYDNNSDYTDDGDGLTLPTDTTPGDPCLDHAPDNISPIGGEWTDVRVTEHKVGAIWRNFVPTISARARVEIHPRISGTRFKPLAIPDNVVTKVQVRYFDQCADPDYEHPLVEPIDLAPLPDSATAAYRSGGGGTLWGVKVPGSKPPVGDPKLSINLPMTAYDPGDCGDLQYRPIVEQVRLASSNDVNLNASCKTLKDTAFADCFNRLSQIRIWDDGDPSADEPLLKDVNVLGGCGTPGDAYFSTLPLGKTTCPIGVTAKVDWGSRDDDELNVPANFTVSANGTPLTQIADDGTTKTYSSANIGNFPPGGTKITIRLTWADTTVGHTWEGHGNCNATGSNPCKYNAGSKPAEPEAHWTFVGRPSQCTKTSGPCSDATATGAVEFVHTSLAPVDSAGAPGPSFDNWVTSTPGGNPCISPCAIFPTVGTRGALTVDTPVTLRTETSQGSQLVDCDPNVTGNVLENFKFGCQPYFGPNFFEDSPSWWNDVWNSPGVFSCPSKATWYKVTPTNPQYTNTPTNPWRCVIQHGGSISGSAGDWMAVATDNCRETNEPANTQCTDFKTKTDLDVHCADYEAWMAAGGNSNDPRVIELFVVPYQSLKGVSGHDEIPILKMASFYVMNWMGQKMNGSADDPCPDTDFYGAPFPTEPLSHPKDDGVILGVFKSVVTPDPGPVDLTKKCLPDDPTPCAAVLVR